jgi:hypothetical protein
MKQYSERTLGARLLNAEILSSHVSTFANYVPIRPEDSVANYKAFIANVKTTNTIVATNLTAYSSAVESRQNVFSKNDDSLKKSIIGIAAYARSKFGRNSKEVKDITALIVKIRGESTKKLKRDDQGNYVSQSELSYGSQTTHFAEIIGTDYAPTNASIKLANLNTLLNVLTASNIAVASAYGKLKTIRDSRFMQYKELKTRSIRVKDAVCSIYGFKSTEYMLIKGLTI